MWYIWTAILLVSSVLGDAEPGPEGFPGPPPEGPSTALLRGPTTGLLGRHPGRIPEGIEGQLGRIPLHPGVPLKEPGRPFRPFTERPPEAPTGVATTHTPQRTLDRKADELAWKSWLQSSESGNANAPPRRITTKSLFITPLVCPKGQRLDRNACVQELTVNNDVHVNTLLEQLNAIFTPATSGDVVYDYGDEQAGPLQLTFPILDSQAAPLQGQEPSAQAQELQPSYVSLDKKEDTKPNGDTSIEAELELLKLQQNNNAHNAHNDTKSPDTTHLVNHNLLNNLLSQKDKPKRDSTVTNTTDTSTNTDQGQKEQVYGHVNVDPVLYGTNVQNTEIKKNDQSETVAETTTVRAPVTNNSIPPKLPVQTLENDTDKHDKTQHSPPPTTQLIKKDKDQTKLNPETDYSDIGEAIKLISRYAEVTTDDNFSKNQKKFAIRDENVLGTRTKLQYRRTKTPGDDVATGLNDKLLMEKLIPKKDVYYRYHWPSQHLQTPPPGYPFRHVQDYWQGRNQARGLYNPGHENPRRHHHFLRPHGYPAVSYPTYKPVGGYADRFPGYHRPGPQHAAPRPRTNNQDLYTLLGLRHWFSSDSTSKR